MTIQLSWPLAGFILLNVNLFLWVGHLGSSSRGRFPYNMDELIRAGLAPWFILDLIYLCVWGWLR